MGGSGIDIQITTQNANITNDIWHIDPTSQYGSDIEINMNHEWGFHPDVQSTINLRIDGFTSNLTEDDGEILILFGVGDKQYFATFISLEEDQSWKTYPGWNALPLATTDSIVADIIHLSQPTRYHRVSGSNSSMDNWVNIGTESWYNNPLEWPLNIEIINNPITNTTTYRLPDQGLTVTFATSFATNQGMNVYIMKDASDGEFFDIYSIDVTYTYYTETPTNAPTEAPTTPYPSTSPTSNITIVIIVGVQTTSTTISPTVSPTLDQGSQISDDGETEPKIKIHIILFFALAVALLCCMLFAIGFFVLYTKQVNNTKATPIESTSQNEQESKAETSRSGTSHNKRGGHGVSMLSPRNTPLVSVIHEKDEETGTDSEQLYVKHRTVGYTEVNADEVPLKNEKLNEHGTPGFEIELANVGE